MLFGGRRINYDEHVLEPRPWTQAQSDWGRNLLTATGPGPVLELCAGAGHIGLLAMHGTGRHLVQVDSNGSACAWARHNARAWGMEPDIRESPMDSALAADERFALILADPPWVPSARVGDFPGDPPPAIDGGDDGLDIARTCLAVIAGHLTDSGSAVLQLGNVEQAQALEPSVADHGLRVVEVRRHDPRGVLLLLSRTPKGDAMHPSSNAEHAESPG